MPHADRALEWIDVYGDRDGDGFIDISGRAETGLGNQGWKDSFDAISLRDGSYAQAAIALCEARATPTARTWPWPISAAAWATPPRV